MRDAVLAGHVAAGALALLLAWGLLAGRGRWAGRAGRAYGGLVAAGCGSALVLTGWQSGLPASARVVLAVVAVATVTAAVAGLTGARVGSPGHLRLLHGSVVSLVTAVAVVSAPVGVWIVVAVAGTLLVEATAARRHAAAGAAAGTQDIATAGTVTGSGPRSGAASR